MLYFVETTGDTIAEDRIKALDLGYAFAPDWSVASRRTLDGPSGNGGVVFANNVHNTEPLGFWPDRQTWQKIPGQAAWVGFGHAIGPPGPEQLACREQLRGHLVRLSDDREWLVPVARAYADDDPPTWFIALPTVSRLDEAGEWQVGEVQPRHARLWELAQRFFDALHAAAHSADDAGDDERPITFSFAELHDAAVVALATNYRVSAVECSMLGLLTSDACSEVLRAVIDWPTISEFVKKQRAAGDSSTPPGRAAAMSATDQRSPISTI